MRLLIVEDDFLVAYGLKQGLERAGFVVDHAPSAESAEQLLNEQSFDLAIVDIGLPQANGLELVKRLRARRAPVPVLILTARDTLDDCVDSLNVGADDFMTKPFRLPELVARVRALVRRSHAVTTSKLSAGPLEMDMGQHVALLHGQPVDLTKREWAILENLLLQSPNVVSKEKLLQSISSWDADLTPNAIEVYVSRLRHKLAPGGIDIRTVRGIGYRLDEPTAA